jgi:PPK2 family polyphosphate:nucleotide phosphotransferase
MSVADRHIVKPGQKVRLSQLDADGKRLEDSKADCREALDFTKRELRHLQERLYAEGKQKLLIIFQAMDAGGKDGTIRAVFSGMNPQGVKVTSFKKPTELELAHDFLWRVHQAVPGNGMIGVFNRSHYEDVVVVRVHNMVPKQVWRSRYDTINQFEQLLTDSGTTIVKFLLHISRAEQKERFQERLDIAEKRWKFSRDDLRKREYWDDYLAAFEDMLRECSTPNAPWYVIPANQNWYRNYAVAKILHATMKKMDPQFPPEPDLADVVIED